MDENQLDYTFHEMDMKGVKETILAQFLEKQ
jgi:hypothetical protein